MSLQKKWCHITVLLGCLLLLLLEGIMLNVSVQFLIFQSKINPNAHPTEDKCRTYIWTWSQFHLSDFGMKNSLTSFGIPCNGTIAGTSPLTLILVCWVCSPPSQLEMTEMKGKPLQNHYQTQPLSCRRTKFMSKSFSYTEISEQFVVREFRIPHKPT